MAAGVKSRFLVAVLVTADTNDYGLLEPIVAETEKTLSRAGVEDVEGLQIAADAGHCAQADLAFAERVRDRIDLLIDGAREPEKRSGLFRRDRFVIADDAGRLMKGPTSHTDGRAIWTGIGCGDCPLRP